MRTQPKAPTWSPFLAFALAMGLCLAACGGHTHDALDAAVDAPDGDGCGGCDDQIACTRDACVGGACVHTPDDAACDGGPCRTTHCVAETGCSAELLPDGTWCGPPRADGAPPRVCDGGDCLRQRVVGVESWMTVRVDTPELDSEVGFFTYLARVTDRDGDGVDDVAAHVLTLEGELGSFGDVPGGVRLYSFPGGETLWALEPQADELNLGRDLVSPGDLDGDEATDLVFTVERGGLGAVRAVDANDGHTLWEAPTLFESVRLFVVDDIDADGARDLVVDRLMDDQPARLTLISAQSGAELATLDDRGGSISFYYTAVGASDVDGDEVPDLCVSVGVSADGPSSVLEVLSGADLSSILVFRGNLDYAWPELALGDLTGDGRTEVILDEYGADGGRVSALDIWEGERLWPLPEQTWVDRATYDLNLDGLPDFTAGDWRDQGWTPTWQSAANGELLLDSAPLDEVGTPVRLQHGGQQVPDVNGDGAEDWLVPYRSPRGWLLVLSSELEVER